MKVQQVEVHDVDNFYYKKTVVLSKYFVCAAIYVVSPFADGNTVH